MDASTFLSYLVSHYGVGLVEYAQVRGVDQVLRVGEGAQAPGPVDPRELVRRLKAGLEASSAR